LGARGEACTIIKQSQSQVCSSGQRCWQLIVSGLVRWSLVTIRVIGAWQVVCLVEALLFVFRGGGNFLSLL
jgi:hypothetical protein